MSLKDLLADLQKDYIRSLPGKITNLHFLWQEGRHEELVTEYHKLKGTGRTYGVPEISQLGEALETLLESPASQSSSQNAVELSLRILERIHAARVAGNAHKLDDDRDFHSIIELALRLGSRTS
jgi:HPt (histidine-containing phosphotransfer) domain-containing protein